MISRCSEAIRIVFFPTSRMSTVRHIEMHSPIAGRSFADDGACRVGVVDFDTSDCIARQSIESLWHLWYRDHFNSVVGDRVYRRVPNRAQRRRDEQHDDGEQQRFRSVRCRSLTQAPLRANNPFKAVLKRTANGMQSSKEEIDAKKKKYREEVKAGYFRFDSCVNTRNSLRFPTVLSSLSKIAVNCSRSDYYRSLNFG